MAWRIDFPHAARFFWIEIAIRTVIITAFIITEDLVPFTRIIQPEEQWLYKYPQTDPYVSTPALYAIAVTSSILIVLLFLALQRNIRESWEAILVPSLSIPLTGLITNAIKNTVGRPRPDFFDRCYPGVKNFDATQPCTGPLSAIIEGRKSFPSGHASISFCTFLFVSLYTAGQLGAFNSRGRGQTWRVLVCMVPILAAILLAVSRTCDYHHHWQDVTVGGIIGLIISYTVYRQYFPSVASTASAHPYVTLGTNYQQLPTTSTSASCTTPLRHSFPGQQQQQVDPIKRT